MLSSLLLSVLLTYSWATGSSTGAGWFLLLLARRENREFREASDLEELELRDLVDTEAAWDLGFSLNIKACSAQSSQLEMLRS